MATINGKTSIFKGLEVQPAGMINTDYETRIDDFLGIATEMATENDFDWENDPETVAELNAWYDSLDTPEAFEEYDAWVTEQERIAIEKEEAEFEAHICSQYDAEVAELENLGDAGRHAIAGHDLVWQAGGTI